MMIDESKLCFRRRESLEEWSLSVLLAREAHKPSEQARHGHVIDRMYAAEDALQIMPDSGGDRRPAEADVVQLFRSNAGEIQARPDRKIRESRIMLDAAQTLLRNSEHHF